MHSFIDFSAKEEHKKCVCSKTWIIWSSFIQILDYPDPGSSVHHYLYPDPGICGPIIQRAVGSRKHLLAPNYGPNLWSIYASDNSPFDL